MDQVSYPGPSLPSCYQAIFVEVTIFYANRIDPNQTPHSAASDLGLHCLQMSLLWDASYKWDKTFLSILNIMLENLKLLCR